MRPSLRPFGCVRRLQRLILAFSPSLPFIPTWLAFRPLLTLHRK